MPRRNEAEEAFRATIGELATRAQLDVLEGGREVVQQSAPLWRRVTDGAPCGWCAMLASRGPVYGSAAKAGQGRRYHGHCGCTAEPFDGSWDDWEPTPREQYYDEAYAAVHEPGMTGERTAALMDEWMKANPYQAAAEPEWIQRWRAASSLVPKGEEFGMVTTSLDGAAQRAEMEARILKHYGTLDPEDILSSEQLMMVDRLESDLWVFADKFPGVVNYPERDFKWTAELKAWAKSRGLDTRKRPGTLAQELESAWRSAQESVRDAKSLANNLRSDLARVASMDWDSMPDKVVRVPDLTPFGELGAKSQAALDAIKDAGRALLSEVDNRLAAAIVARGDVPSGPWVRDARARITREVLSEVRPTGGARMSYTGPAELVERMASDADAYYPDEWIQLLRREYGSLDLVETDRGFHSHSKNRIALSRGNTVALHELGHAMESSVPGIRSAEWALHYSRTTKVVDGIRVYDRDQFEHLYGGKLLDGRPEGSFRDDWIEPYSGKVYGWGDTQTEGVGPESQWEIFTMGAESALMDSEYLEVVDFMEGAVIRRDAEYYEWVLGVLSSL